jgi:hypothetical protein
MIALQEVNQMPIANKSFQTVATDTPLPGLLVGNVTRLDVQDPTENHENTSLIELGDPTDVVVDWTLQGPFTPLVGGNWEVTLFIDDIDGQGATHGQLGGPTKVVPVTTGPGATPVPQGPVTFNVPSLAIGVGVYQLVVTINHRAQGQPAGRLTEMTGYAESTPIKVTPTLVESN